MLTAGCFQINWLSAPDDGAEPTTTLPIAGRLPVYLDSVGFRRLEAPGRCRCTWCSGTLPTPCHTLAWDLGEPDADGRIVLSVFSTAGYLHAVCTQVLEPFEKSIPVGSFTSGSYVLVINGVDYPFTIGCLSLALLPSAPDPGADLYLQCPRPLGAGRHYAPSAALIVQRSRTPAFHAGNTGSNPVRGIWALVKPGRSRRPVKPEVAGSNPVVPAKAPHLRRAVR